MVVRVFQSEVDRLNAGELRPPSEIVLKRVPTRAYSAPVPPPPSGTAQLVRTGKRSISSDDGQASIIRSESAPFWDAQSYFFAHLVVR